MQLDDQVMRLLQHATNSCHTKKMLPQLSMLAVENGFSCAVERHEPHLFEDALSCMPSLCSEQGLQMPRSVKKKEGSLPERTTVGRMERLRQHTGKARQGCEHTDQSLLVDG